MTRNSRAFGNMTHVMRIVPKFSLFRAFSTLVIPGVSLHYLGHGKRRLCPSLIPLSFYRFPSLGMNRSRATRPSSHASRLQRSRATGDPTSAARPPSASAASAASLPAPERVLILNVCWNCAVDFIIYGEIIWLFFIV
jgi:hypothetical protein